MRRAVLAALARLIAAATLCGCGGEEAAAPDPAPVTYSSTIQPIFTRSCNTSACHTAADAAAGLDLTSLETLMAGSQYGAVVIAFRPDESHLVSHLTGESTPRMPLSRDPLPETEVDAIRAWVADGARNDAGVLPFADSQRKVYVLDQGSDVISVMDSDALLVTRLIDVDYVPGVDAPHNVHIDRSGRHAYVALVGSATVVRIDTVADSILASARVGIAPAHPVTSPDGGTVYVTDWNGTDPSLHVLDAVTLAERYKIRFTPAEGSLPHGLAITPDGTTLVSVHEGGNSVFKIEPGATAEDAFLTHIPLGGPGEQLRPFQAVLDPAGRFAYVTCSATGEVRVVDVPLAAMVGAIPVGGAPISEGMSPDGRWVYVANWGKDAVDVIETATRSVVATISNVGLERPAFARPHAVAFSSDGRLAFVTNENTNGAYPQHHPSELGGLNGNVTVIDVATRQVVKVIEVEVDPTGLAFCEP